MENTSPLHVITHAKGWAVTRSGASRATKVVSDRGEAVAKARKLASGTVPVYIHDGTGLVTQLIPAASAAR